MDGSLNQDYFLVKVLLQLVAVKKLNLIALVVVHHAIAYGPAMVYQQFLQQDVRS